MPLLNAVLNTIFVMGGFVRRLQSSEMDYCGSFTFVIGDQ